MSFVPVPEWPIVIQSASCLHVELFTNLSRVLNTEYTRGKQPTLHPGTNPRQIQNAV